MRSALEATLIANAGLRLACGGITLLLDGVFGGGHSFSPLPADVWQDMLAGAPPFEKIDYLLFTHDHPDHFSAERTLELLRRRSVRGVFLPDTPLTAPVIEELRRRGLPAAVLSAATDRAVYRLAPEVTVRAFSTGHLDPKYADVRHFCYLLTVGEAKFLFTADVDYTAETLEGLGPLRGAFVNPLFFSALRRGRFFKGALRAETVCVCHVPFAADDRTGERARLAREMASWPPTGGQAVALTEPFQQICF